MIAALVAASGTPSRIFVMMYPVIGVVTAVVYWRLDVAPIPNEDVHDRVRWWLGLAMLWPVAVLLLVWHGATVLLWYRRRAK